MEEVAIDTMEVKVEKVDSGPKGENIGIKLRRKETDCGDRKWASGVKESREEDAGVREKVGVEVMEEKVGMAMRIKEKV